MGLNDHNITATMGRRTLRSIIPDTLYMIEDGNSASEGCSSQASNQLIGLNNPSYYSRGYESLKPGDIGNFIEIYCPTLKIYVLFLDKLFFALLVVDPEVLSAMMYRLKKLQSAHHRNLNLVSRERASRYLRLRVVREFGFPDYVSDVCTINTHITSLILMEKAEIQIFFMLADVRKFQSDKFYCSRRASCRSQWLRSKFIATFCCRVCFRYRFHKKQF